MATIVLQTVGAAIGGAIGGPFGALLGRAAGAAAGYAIDQSVLQKDQVIIGPRLSASRFLSSIEGAPIPKVYGRTKIGGQIIWATRFEEVQSSKKQGGKGGPSSTIVEYNYFANFAVGLCAGPVSHIGRVWADGTELDLTRYKFRIYKGSESQQPDPLIEALQSAGNTPAYRSLAYVVFEDFPIEEYGNRIPQLTFEVVRSIGVLENSIKSVCLIPGSTSYGYSPKLLVEDDQEGVTKSHNRHNLVSKSDWTTSLNELQALCPNLKSISLVVAWFGNDLRADNCTVRPGVERSDITAVDHSWLVSGTDPQNAHQISLINNSPAYGSTPTDKSVMEAIADIRARGLKVTFYPFIMMDIPSTNGLTNPYGGTGQPVYPWRGLITCNPAIGRPGTADKTTQATTQILNFVGDAKPEDFQASENTIEFTGDQQWSYRRMILHYAKLCVAAGGVDKFLIGSEQIGLTNVRDSNNIFPFVQELVSIADGVDSIVGTNTKISYAADWSEYFGYHPQDGSNDLFYSLDPLWASSSIDGVSIDNYMPLADWRENGDPYDTDADEYSTDYFKSNINSGEGFDWYYASFLDRTNATRTPITDGQGEPWVWRYKDLKSWWSIPHHERINGVRSPTPTDWQPQSKPIWFTELGCPAINKGANQPNVFYDEKSSQSAVPYFSNAQRDDLVQRRFLQAQLSYWNSGVQLDDKNPISAIYAGRMLDADETSIWAWDARPYPAFPVLEGVWSDRDNWTQGHWLNGRLGSCALDELVAQILEDYKFDAYDASKLQGWVNGYVIPGAAPVRRVIEPLLSLFGASAVSQNGNIVFIPSPTNVDATINRSQLVERENSAITRLSRLQETDLPKEAIVHHDEIGDNIEGVVSKTRRLESQSERQIQMQLPAVLPSGYAKQLAGSRLRDAWIGRENLKIGLAAQDLQYEAGDVLKFEDANIAGLWQIQAIEEGFDRQVELTKVESATSMGFFGTLPSAALSPSSGYGKPLALLLDIPRSLSTVTHLTKLISATFAKPWAGNYAYASSPDESGFEVRNSSRKRATVAKLVAPLNPGPEGRWDYVNTLKILPLNGEFSATSTLLVLNGANGVAVQSSDGNWELVQYRDVTLETNGTITLSHLLRAQLGTEQQMFAGSSSGSYAVVLDQHVDTITLLDTEINIPQNWRIGPAVDAISSQSYRQQSITPKDRAGIPYSPVHVNARRVANDDIEIDWVRRSRIFGDDWDAADVPLGEAQESYQVNLYDGSAIIRSIDTTNPQCIYSAADQVADFTNLPQSLSLEVAQKDGFSNAGTPRAAQFEF